MYRHSPVRNVRSKGIKIKHVLQICLLVAVCFWLIFQVKRSHDKKKELDASDTKISLSTKSSEEIVKFGRKDLQPKLEETVVKQEEEEQEREHEQEDQEEHEGNKHEEEEEEQDEEKIEEEKDDEIDENEQEKSDVDIDRGEEVDTVDEESDEKENEEKDVQSQSQSQSQSQPETEVSLDENDQDGATRNTREAREEHYKADDASSAVAHDSPTVGIENGNGTLDNSAVDNGETAKNGASSSSNVTESEENGPPSNTTITKSDSTEAQNNEPISNSIVSEETGKTSNSSNILELSEENSKTEVEGEENLDSYESKNRDEVEQERIDSSDLSHLEEKEVRTDLETLPEIETEGGNSEDSAVE